MWHLAEAAPTPTWRRRRRRSSRPVQSMCLCHPYCRTGCKPIRLLRRSMLVVRTTIQRAEESHRHRHHHPRRSSRWRWASPLARRPGRIKTRSRSSATTTATTQCCCCMAAAKVNNSTRLFCFSRVGAGQGRRTPHPTVHHDSRRTVTELFKPYLGAPQRILKNAPRRWWGRDWRLCRSVQQRKLRGACPLPCFLFLLLSIPNNSRPRRHGTRLSVFQICSAQAPGEVPPLFTLANPSPRC